MSVEDGNGPSKRSKLEENIDVLIGDQSERSELSMKMDVVNENLQNIIANQRLIIVELQKSNQILQEISKQT